MDRNTKETLLALRKMDGGRKSLSMEITMMVAFVKDFQTGRGNMFGIMGLNTKESLLVD